MIVKIVDPEHPHYGEQGALRSKVKVNGRILEVLMNNRKLTTQVEKRQVKAVTA